MSPPKVALYLRLSRDDERAGESASIENQRSVLRQYAAAQGWQVAGEYADDGWSGLTFERPQFRRLLADLDRGQADTVLTKDLSRLGRDQIYTAYYCQVYFPQRGIRYIALAEGVDTGQGGTGLLFPFLAAANDFYTADVSRKVRSALTARKREGKFVGAKAPLGYRKDPEHPGHLLVDEEKSGVIRHIFARYLTLGSVSGVARELTREGVPTPGQGGRFPGLWSDTTVRRILTNPTYAGHLTQNRREKVNYKVSKRRELPREEWITVPNTHQPLVDQGTFDRVQGLLALRSYHGEKRGEGRLTGLVFCGRCHSPMTRVGSSLVCQGYRRGGGCTPHRVKEEGVLRAIRGELVQLAREIDREGLARVWRPRGEESTALEGQMSLFHREGSTRTGPEAVEELLAFRDLSRGELAALVERVEVKEGGAVEVWFRVKSGDRRYWPIER